MKKHVDFAERIAAAVIALILGVTAAVLLCMWILNRPPEVQGTGIPGESLELRRDTVGFIRENEALLRRAAEELETLRRDTYEVFYDRVSGEYIANNGTWHPLENEFLLGLLEDTAVDWMDRAGGSWLFHLEWGENSLFECKYYYIVYSDGDPAPDIADAALWEGQGSGRTARLDSRQGHLYLEEIGGGFWYYYKYMS